MRRRVPPAGGEKESLHVALDRHRDVVVWKLQGLDEEQARRPMTPTGTSLLGIVRHLAAVEYGWFRETFGRDVEPLWFAPEDDFHVGDDDTVARVTAFYGRARAAADEVISELDLDEFGTSWSGERVTLRWVLVHMLEETARHAGHLDILRELVDGATGDHPQGGPR